MEKIRELVHAAPFRPFLIHLADGRQAPVRHPDFIALAPSGATLTLYGLKDELQILDVPLVPEKPRPGGRRKAA